MQNFKLLIAIGWLGLVSLNCYGEDLANKSKEMSLKEAIFLALRYNPSIKTAEIDRVVQKFQLFQVQNEYELQYALQASAGIDQSRFNGTKATSNGASVLPSVSKQGIYGTQMSVGMNNAVNDSKYGSALDLNLTQPLLSGFGKEVNLANYYNAQDQELANRLALKQTVMDTVQQVINNYYQVISAQYNVVTAQLSLSSYKKTIENDKALIKAGEKAPTEILTAQSSYASEQVTLQDNKNAVISSKLNLLNTIGMAPHTEFIVPVDINVEEPHIPTLEEATDVALNNNPGYLQSLLSIQTTKRALLLSIDAARAKLNLIINATSGNTTQGGGGPLGLINNKNKDVSAGLELTIPIDDYTLQGAIVSAKAAVESAEIQLQNAKRALKIQIINDITSVKSQWEALKLAEQTLMLQTKNQEFLNAKLKYGLVSTFEVTQQQQNLNTYRNTLIASKISYASALVALYADMGILLDKWNISVIY